MRGGIRILVVLDAHVENLCLFFFCLIDNHKLAPKYFYLFGEGLIGACISLKPSILGGFMILFFSFFRINLGCEGFRVCSVRNPETVLIF